MKLEYMVPVALEGQEYMVPFQIRDELSRMEAKLQRRSEKAVAALEAPLVMERISEATLSSQPIEIHVHIHQHQ